MRRSPSGAYEVDLEGHRAGKHIYTEKPIAESVDEGIELVTGAREAGVINGVVHDKLYLPGLLKLKRLIDSGFFGRILSVRGEFGYWVLRVMVVPPSGPAGTTAPRTAAAWCWTCSPTELRPGELVQEGMRR